MLLLRRLGLNVDPRDKICFTLFPSRLHIVSIDLRPHQVSLSQSFCEYYLREFAGMSNAHQTAMPSIGYGATAKDKL